MSSVNSSEAERKALWVTYTKSTSGADSKWLNTSPHFKVAFRVRFDFRWIRTVLCAVQRRRRPRIANFTWWSLVCFFFLPLKTGPSYSSSSTAWALWACVSFIPGDTCKLHIFFKSSSLEILFGQDVPSAAVVEGVNILFTFISLQLERSGYCIFTFDMIPIFWYFEYQPIQKSTRDKWRIFITYFAVQEKLYEVISLKHRLIEPICIGQKYWAATQGSFDITNVHPDIDFQSLLAGLSDDHLFLAYKWMSNEWRTIRLSTGPVTNVMFSLKKFK